MPFRSLFSLVCTALVVLVSCVRPTALDPKAEPEVIVNCVLKYPHQEQELTLCYTTSPSGTGGEGIDAAIIVLHDETAGETLGEFSYQGGGRWVIPATVVPGHRYSLHIDVAGGPSLEASTTVPTIYEVKYEPWSTSRVLVSQYDSDFFTVKSSSCYHTEFLGEDAFWVYALSYDPATSCWNIVDRIMTECQSVDPFNQRGGALDHPGQSYVPKSILGWKYATFREAVFHYRYLRIPLPGQYQYVEPSSFQKLTNWEIPSITRSSTTSFFLEPEVEEPYIAQEEWESWSKDHPLLSALPSAGPQQPGSQVVFMFCSEEYDRYLKGSLSYYLRQNSDDITAIYDRSNVYGNIQGGHGIFGACISYYLPWFPSRRMMDPLYE